jgi:hypothetical protein
MSKNKTDNNIQFNDLVNIIQDTSVSLQKKALNNINQLLVIRNSLIGCYIVEYEQNGKDRAKYGEKLLASLAKELKNKKLRGLSKRNLHLFVQFYNNYPQIVQTVSAQLPEQKKEKMQTLSAQFSKNIQKVFEELSPNSILFQIQKKGQTASDKLEQYIEPEILLTHRSFSHFIELIKISDPLKRLFYEAEAIKRKLER